MRRSPLREVLSCWCAASPDDRQPGVCPRLHRKPSVQGASRVACARFVIIALSELGPADPALSHGPIVATSEKCATCKHPRSSLDPLRVPDVTKLHVGNLS